MAKSGRQRWQETSRLSLEEVDALIEQRRADGGDIVIALQVRNEKQDQKDREEEYQREQDEPW